MSLVSRLIYLRQSKLVGRLVKEVLALYGVEVPAEAEIGRGLNVLHRGFGTVIHPNTRIGANVTIYHSVTLGRADAWLPREESRMERIVVEDDVILCPGATVLCKDGILRIGRGTVVGANAVLNRSTGPGEIWAGVPARKIGHR